MTALNHGETEMSHTNRWTANVAVRVPRDSGRSLPAAATRRLESASGVDSVEVESVRSLDPALAATVIHLNVVVMIGEDQSPETVETALEAAPGTEHVETTAPVSREPPGQRQHAPPD